MPHSGAAMLTKFMPRPHFFPSTSIYPTRFFPKPSSLPKPLSLSLLSITTSGTTAAAASLDQTFFYGPSLHKGHEVSHNRHLQPPITAAISDRNEHDDEEVEDDCLFDRESFTRIFDIAALRVPAERCFSLESRLRGHLLNWPRIRNIARVPGDEVEDEYKKLLRDPTDSGSDDDNGCLVSLNRRIYGKAEGDCEPLSPVVYRDKLVKTFNSRGFVKFRNLAKLSRPKKRKKKGKGEERGKLQRKGVGKNEFAVVEVVEEEGDKEEEEDLSGLLGVEFKGRKWRGSTRLLLLDERYASEGLDQLPEAIKVVGNEDGREDTTSNFELVRCRLTLFYNYWGMNEILEALLPKGMIVPSAFETVGHIAHLNLRDEHLPYKKLIAKVVLDKNMPKIQTVVNKIDAIHNDYRTMQLEVLAGNHSLVTTVVENGLRFHVDLATVYWNSRLETERQRLLNCFTCDDVVSVPIVANVIVSDNLFEVLTTLIGGWLQFSVYEMYLFVVAAVGVDGVVQLVVFFVVVVVVLVGFCLLGWFLCCRSFGCLSGCALVLLTCSSWVQQFSTSSVQQHVWLLIQLQLLWLAAVCWVVWLGSQLLWLCSCLFGYLVSFAAARQLCIAKFSSSFQPCACSRCLQQLAACSSSLQLAVAANCCD
ncbi:tRNA (guanine(37)-N(1))-methyltransferase [Sarracenia purpurea var. burkii]